MSLPVFAWETHIISVSERDIIIIEGADGEERITVRLHGIDPPELKQPYGETARTFIFDVSLAKRINAEELYSDVYNYTVAVVTFQDGISLQAVLVESGLAWVRSLYCTNCAQWESLLQETHKERRDLWADEKPMLPWDWCKRSKKKRTLRQ